VVGNGNAVYADIQTAADNPGQGGIAIQRILGVNMQIGFKQFN
jgi:hypothetical protein